MKQTTLLIVAIILGILTLAVVVKTFISPPFDTALGGFVSTIWAGYWAAYSTKSKDKDDDNRPPPVS